MNWRNRIVGYEQKRAGDFLPNELNWRIHPQGQRSALRGALAEIGWIGCAVENIRTGRLIDGHMRVEEALKISEDELVPTLFVDLSAHEEALALATLDPIGGLGVAEKELLESVMREANTGDTDLQRFLSDYAVQKGLFREATSKDEVTAAKQAEQAVRELPPSEEPAKSTSRYQQRFAVLVEVETQEQQEELFNRLQAEGWTCRATTL